MNCKEEFLKEIEGHKLKCAVISQEGFGTPRSSTLAVGFTPAELEEFLAELNFKYDSGYGSQELFGIIWYEDGTWSERGEYDGSEWWVYKSCPEIPIELKKK